MHTIKIFWETIYHLMIIHLVINILTIITLVLVGTQQFYLKEFFAGFKTILKPYDTPLTKLNSNIKSIFLSKEESLKDQIKKYINYSDYEFYLEKDILNYTNRF